MDTAHRRGDPGQPRYTGRQVWNRQQSHHQTEQPIDGIHRHQEIRHWASPHDWAISDSIAHPPLISETDFVAAQSIRTVPKPANGTPRTYLLSKLVYCGRCGRALDAHWANRRPGYRCRHGYTSTRKPNPDRPKTLYIREDHLFTRLWTTGLHPRHRLTWLVDTNHRHVVKQLHHHGMNIICSERGWILVSMSGITTL